MAFTPDTQPTPTEIGDISLEIFDGDTQSVTYSIQVVRVYMGLACYTP